MKQTLTLVSHFEVMLCQMICRLYFWQKQNQIFQETQLILLHNFVVKYE